MDKQDQYIRYLHISPRDEMWGLSVTTVGQVRVAPNSTYPDQGQHPASYQFQPQQGRILPEYQLVYISEGSGFFQSASCPRRPVSAGTMLLLFPGEWHTYSPGPMGWFEHWVGFRGNLIERWISNKFFTKSHPIYNIGVRTQFISLYKTIIRYAKEEQSGYQQAISGAVLSMLGELYFCYLNEWERPLEQLEKINQARSLMKEHIDHPLPVEKIAEQLNVSYSWFRSNFKKQTGVSPAQYQINLRLIRAKELLSLTQMSISEIAYKLNFESVSHFSTFFTKREKQSPSAYREQFR